MAPTSPPSAIAVFNECCREVGYVPTADHPAKLTVGNQVLYGWASVDAASGVGGFVPRGKPLDKGKGVGTLVLRDTARELWVEFYPCPAGKPEYHLRVRTNAI